MLYIVVTDSTSCIPMDSKCSRGTNQIVTSEMTGRRNPSLSDCFISPSHYRNSMVTGSGGCVGLGVGGCSVLLFLHYVHVLVHVLWEHMRLVTYGEF